MRGALEGLLPPRGRRLAFLITIWPALALVCLVAALIGAAPAITRFFDPSDLYVDQGISGPYAWARSDPDGTNLGPRLPFVVAGASFGVVSVFCPERHASYSGVTEIQREEDGEVMMTRRRDYEPGTRGCGPLAATFSTSVDWPPGLYRLTRRATIRAPGRRLLTRELDGLTFLVAPPRRTPVERPILYPRPDGPTDGADRT